MIHIRIIFILTAIRKGINVVAVALDGGSAVYTPPPRFHRSVSGLIGFPVNPTISDPPSKAIQENSISMWPKIISDLIAANYTEQSIADKVGVSQPTIHRLKAGSRGSPRHEVGELLLKLHKKAKRAS